MRRGVVSLRMPLAETCRAGDGPDLALTVTPAKAGAQRLMVQCLPLWVPAFAGMTTDGSKLPIFGHARRPGVNPKPAEPLYL